MTPIHFIPNEPQVLSLKETSGCMDGFNVLYELSDGRTLQLPRPAAIKLNITRFVVDGLKEVGEQWNDQAKQDAICSVLISASRQGLLTLWERGGVE